MAKGAIWIEPMTFLYVWRRGLSAG